MPALQLKKFTSDEEHKGQDPTGFTSVFVVPPAAQKKTKSEKRIQYEQNFARGMWQK